MFKKIFNDLFSPGTLQAESTASAALPETFNASASLSADAIHDLECRKRAIVADITLLAAELAACPDLGAPVGDGPIGVGPIVGSPALAAGCANPDDLWLNRPATWTGNVAVTRADLSAILRDADRDYGRPSSALSPTWAAPERAGTCADLAAKLHEAGLAAERAAEARGKGLKR